MKRLVKLSAACKACRALAPPRLFDKQRSRFAFPQGYGQNGSFAGVGTVLGKVRMGAKPERRVSGCRFYPDGGLRVNAEQAFQQDPGCGLFRSALFPGAACQHIA